MVGSVAGDLPEQVKNNQSVNMAAGNGGQKMSQYSWFTVYFLTAYSKRRSEALAEAGYIVEITDELQMVNLQ